MIGGRGFVTLDMDMKRFFFDRQIVKRAVNRERRQLLSKAGAFVRQRARSSIRKRRGSSLPGMPPSSHTGLLRRHIYFAYDPINDSVVIGPAALRNWHIQRIPETLEYGGRVVTTAPMLVPVGAVGRNRAGRFTARRLKRVPAGTALQYRPRPFMGPALRAEVPNLPRLWRNSVRGGGGV